MSRPLFAAVAALLLLAACAKTDAPPPAAAPAPVTQPGASAQPLPSPLLNQPGKSANFSGGSPADCQQQCEHGYQVCMDGTAARSDVMSGTMQETRMFGPAARCEVSLASCLRRCNSAAPKK